MYPLIDFDAEEADSDRDGERGSGIDSEDSRIGQRVAGQSLDQSAGESEPHADKDPENRSRGSRSSRTTS